MGRTRSTHAEKRNKVDLCLCLSNSALRHEDVWGSGCVDPCIFDLGISWRCVVSFTPRALHPITFEDGYAPEPVWMTWIGEKCCHYRDLNSELSAVQPDYAIPCLLEEKNVCRIVVGKLE
jgi:hypothetical protein